MNQQKKELIEKVESGEYFSEAKNWYLSTYIYRFVERSYLIIIGLALIFLLYLTHDYKSSIMPIKKSMPVRVEISDQAKEYTKITYLGNKKKDFDVNKTLIKYFSARFVEAVESYDYRNDFKKLKKNTNIIKKLGTDGIQNYYENKISIQSPDSFVLKYRKNVTREVFIDEKKIEVANLSDKEDPDFLKQYLVTINYTIREIYRKEQEVKLTNWQAQLKLEFENINYDFEEKSFNDLNFKVSEYESKKLK